MNILYIDPVFGISGDMMISAFLDLGLPIAHLEGILNSLPLSLPRLRPVTKVQGVVRGIHLEIDDSDLHLSVTDMEQYVDGLTVPERVKADARGMLERIITAEAKVHGTTRESVHLHELSHVDTLIDVLSVAVAMAYFQIDRVYCGPIPMGRGTIRTSHGVIPNPPPVTLEILSHLPLLFLEEPLELTTPTGAAIVGHFVKTWSPPPAMRVHRSGCGVGTYKSEKPDVLRLFLGTDEEGREEELWVLETDIDDMDMEYLGAAAEAVREAGALDVLYFPVHMKKDRVGIRFCVSASPDRLEDCLDAVFRETSTFGVRLRKEKRRVLLREERTISTSRGPVRVKYGWYPDGRFKKRHIEFEDVRKLAKEHKVPVRLLLDDVRKEIDEKD